MAGGWMLPVMPNALLLYFTLTAVLVMSWTYTYSNDTMTWTEANTWCENQSQTLMFILNEEENNFLKVNVPKGQPYYWIGLRKNESRWFWHGTGKMLEGTGSWAQHEPNNKKQDEDCVEIYINDGDKNGKWNDEKCGKTKRALCYNASCFERSCSERGVCVEIISNYTCNCYPGFTGPRCEEVVKCPPIATVPDGRMNCSHPLHTNSYNSTCVFSCDEGFELRGSHTTLCNHTGHWTHNTPTCTVVKCPPIATVPDGRMNCSHPLHTNSYNSTCVFSCDEGFELRGSHTTLCNHTGHWTHNTPTCTVVKCPPIATVPDGRMNCSHPLHTNSYNSTCVFSCDEGFELRGSHTTLCNHTGHWTHNTPTCTGYTRMLMALSGSAAFSTVCCSMFCFSCCRKKKKFVKTNSDQEEVMNAVYDAGDAPLEAPLSSA